MQALWFLIDTVASLLVGALLLRTYMNWLGLRGRDPLSQFVFAVTNWCVLPLRKLVPARGRWDLATLVGAFLIAFVAALLFNLMFGRDLIAALASSALMALLWMIKYGLYAVMFILLASAILSWVNPQAPMAPVLDTLTRPILDPIRKVVPLLGGVDLSPLVALVGIQFLMMLSQSLLGRGLF